MRDEQINAPISAKVFVFLLRSLRTINSTQPVSNLSQLLSGAERTHQLLHVRREETTKQASSLVLGQLHGKQTQLGDKLRVYLQLNCNPCMLPRCVASLLLI